MKINKENLPVIPERNGRKVVDIAVEDLKSTGVSFNSFGINRGDVIQFPESAEEMVVKQMDVNPNSTAKVSLVSVLRNDKEDFLAMGSLSRRDADMKAACPFVEEMNKLSNDKERVEALFGKTIKCTDTVERDTRRFENGQPVGGPEGRVKRPFPIIEYVE